MAEANLRADSNVAAGAWRLLTEINANLQRRNEAQSALEIALQHPLGGRLLALQHALSLEVGRDVRAALAELEAQARVSPQLLVQLARAAIARSEAGPQASLRCSPIDIALQQQLARLRRQRGASGGATAFPGRAIARQGTQVVSGEIAVPFSRVARQRAFMESGRCVAAAFDIILD